MWIASVLGFSSPGLNPFSNYISESISNKTKVAFGYPNQASYFWSPGHYIGSFSFPMRVNTDGQTATVAVYDRKSVASLTDNLLGTNSNNSRYLQSTYQRFVWTIRLK